MLVGIQLPAAFLMVSLSIHRLTQAPQSFMLGRLFTCEDYPCAAT